MDIHSDILTEEDIIRATVSRGMKGVRANFSKRGSRSRRHKFDVKLTGNSRHRPAGGSNDPEEYTATWDEWGIFLQSLYDVDPGLKTQPYPTEEDFERKTYWRYSDLEWEDQHVKHNWEYLYPREFVCECGARRSAN